MPKKVFYVKREWPYWSVRIDWAHGSTYIYSFWRKKSAVKLAAALNHYYRERAHLPAENTWDPNAGICLQFPVNTSTEHFMQTEPRIVGNRFVQQSQVKGSATGNQAEQS
jgi:hypothetical protein